MIKAYFIMRDDLNMSQAKFGIQIGHGTDIIWSVINNHPIDDVMSWVNEYDRRKIILKISSLQKLENLKKTLKDNGIVFGNIVDKGYTEFNGETLTGIVIPPMYSEETLNKMSSFKRLRLWT